MATMQAAKQFAASVIGNRRQQQQQHQQQHAARNDSSIQDIAVDTNTLSEGQHSFGRLGNHFFNKPAHIITSAPSRALHQVDGAAVYLNNGLTSSDSCPNGRRNSSEMILHVPPALLTPTPSCGKPGVRDERPAGGSVGYKWDHVPGSWRELLHHTPKHLRPVRYFKEIFAGCGRLTAACRADGSWTVLDPADAYPKGGAYRAQDDMLKRAGVCRLLTEIKRVAKPASTVRHTQIFDHFGIVCASFSRLNVNFNQGTRTKDMPLRDGSLQREVVGNLLCESAVTVIRALLKVGGLFSIENPTSSFLWLHPTIKALRLERGVRLVRFCQCMYGLQFPDSSASQRCQKDTTLVTNAPLSSLECMCDHSHEHMHAKGAIKVGGHWRQRTELAGRCPPRLCKQWSKCFCDGC